MDVPPTFGTMPNSRDVKDDHSKQNNFNLFRLMAAFFVVVSHSFGLLLRGNEQPGIHLQHQFIILSDMGLFIFFAISGYLVTQSLLHSPTYKIYLWKRFLRIVPALVVVNIACVLMGLWLTTLSPSMYLSNKFTWQYLLLNSTLVHNQFVLPGVFASLNDKSINASIWTILLEVRFYILLLIANIFTLLKRKYLLLIIFLLLQIARIFFSVYSIDTKGIYVDVYFQYGSIFFTGMLFAIFQQSLQKKPIIMLLLILVGLMIPVPVIQSIFLVVPTTYFILKLGKSSTILNLKGMDLSYGLYLYAFPIQQLLLLHFGYEIPVWLHIISTTVIALFFAAFSWFFIEKPALHFKTRMPRFLLK